MAVQVFQPFEFFSDINGHPVDDGFIYIGVANLDPLTNPISVFFDEALTIPATQPIRTRNGYPANAGVQTQIFVAETTFSISIRNKNGTVIRAVPAVHSATDLEGRLRDTVSASNGASIVGWTRLPLNDGIATVHQMLDAQAVNPWEYESLIVTKPNPADPTTWDWTPALQAALSSGALYVEITTEIRIGLVSVPSRCTLVGAGGKIKFILGTTPSGINLTNYSALVGLRVDVSGPDSLGTSAAVNINGKYAKILGCSFEGETAPLATDNKLNYTIRISNTNDCSDCVISNNLFLNTRWGIIRQLGNPGYSANLKVIGNTFSGITRGDAIQLNVGNDIGHVIANNTFNNISDNGITNAGMAIGIAGDDALSGPAGDETRRFIIAGNTVNTAVMGIHVEGCNNFSITDNNVFGVTGGTGSEGGITCYGCDNFVVAGNHTTGNSFGGIRISPESTDLSYSATLAGNSSSAEPRAIFVQSNESGKLITISGNTALGSTVGGINCTGGANWSLVGNSMHECAFPLILDMNSAANSLSLTGNVGLLSTNPTSIVNAASTIIAASANPGIIGFIEREVNIAVDATTFDARASARFATQANTVATAITAITGRTGQQITIRGGSSTNATTIADAGNFRLSAAITLNTHTTITLYTVDGATWIEVSRSIN